MPVEQHIRLQHMLDAAQEAVEFVEGRDEQHLFSDRQLLLAVVKSIEIIGEAARSIPEDIRQNYPQVPWPQIVGMRHHLVHVYFDIDANVVWKTVKADLPPLIAQLTAILQQRSSPDKPDSPHPGLPSN